MYLELLTTLTAAHSALNTQLHVECFFPFRAFHCWEDGVTADSDQEHKERTLLEEYKNKLLIDDCVVPDPLTLKTGWLKEDENGLVKWPSLYFHDIATYLQTKTSSVLMNHLINEYKEGKAYRYFTCHFVKEVYYHDISASSKVCILKCKVTPSQRISSKPYDVWAFVEKNTNEKAGGTIKHCYCTCTASLHGACNHIVGLLFRVESAVFTGVTKTSCTDHLAKWTIPPAKSDTTPGPVSNIIFKKDHYKSFTTVDREKQESNIKGRISFSPMSEEQRIYLQNDAKVRQDLMNIFKVHAPQSCFMEIMEAKKLNVKAPVHCPKSIIDRATDFSMDDTLSLTENVKQFVSKDCRFTADDRLAIFKSTTGQSENKEWYHQRKGRMTASKFRQIYTRCKSLKAEHTEDPTSLLSLFSLDIKLFLTLQP